MRTQKVLVPSAKNKTGPKRGSAFNAFAPAATRNVYSAPPPFGGGRYASAAEDDDDFDEGYQEPAIFVPSHLRGRSPQAYGRGGGSTQRRGRVPQQPAAPPPVSMEQVLSHVHDAVGQAVWEAVEQIMHLESNWSEDQVAKRLVKYIYRSASDEKLLTLEWDQLCEQLAKGMFHGFSSSCGETEWFHMIDLTPALSAAAMVLLPAAGWRVPPQQVHHTVSVAYQGLLDKNTLDRAVWEMVQNLFEDEKVRTKVFNAMTRSFEPARDRARNDMAAEEDMDRVESFMRSWIDDTACRAWGGLSDQAEEVVNQESLVQMFDHLLQPFGEEHPFSAVPREFTVDVGAPPPGWDFIPQAVEDLFINWANSESQPRKRRKKGGGGGGDDDAAIEELMGEAESAANAEEGEAGPVVQKKMAVSKKIPAIKKVKSEASGHPECTSGEDCAGASEDSLVRHVLEDGPGDVYCKVCFTSFQQRNPDLEGVAVEE